MTDFPVEFVWFEVVEIGEPSANALRIVVAESIAREEQTELIAPGIPVTARPMTVGPDSRVFEFLWNEYVSYTVTNESFALPDDKGEAMPGGAFFEFRSSQRLEFARSMTFAEFVFKKPIRHWCLGTQNHVIDVISFEPPVINRLDNYKFPEIDSPREVH